MVVIEKRTKIIKIRVNDSEYFELVKRSLKPRLAEWMREYCLGAKVPRANTVPKIDPALLRQLAAIGNNINQIARVLNSKDWKPVERIQLFSLLSSIQRELSVIKFENTHDDR